jgi:prepilin-type N-terminal cleavage/methylation domain-containing protein
MTFRTGNKVRARQRAFTLIELILVMALLIVAISLVTPKVIAFFDGRSLDSEVRRFISLTHYGQSRAVSEGLPTMLWIDEVKGTYGLKIQTGYADKDPRAVEYHVGKGLKMEIIRGSPVAPIAYSQTGRILNGQVAQGGAKLPSIYFSPGGNVTTLSSIIGLTMQEANTPPVWIGPSANRLSYEVQDQVRILANLRR